MYLAGMPHPVRTCLVLAFLTAAGGLAACTTPTAKPQVSQAVVDARARRNTPPPPTCPQDPISAVAPVTIGFAFNESELTEAMSRQLVAPARWLTCHPAVAAVVRPDADGHGTDAEQDALARKRAEVVRSYLTARGVPADRVRILARAAAEPTGEVLLIHAEGRRW